MEDSKKSTVTSFRLNNDLIQKISELQDSTKKKKQEIMETALNLYFEKMRITDDDLEDMIKDNDSNNEFMLIPIDYYAKYNDLAMIEVLHKIKQGKLKSVTYSGVKLIIIDTSKEIYKKAELFVIRDNISTAMKEIGILKKEMRALKKADKSNN